MKPDQERAGTATGSTLADTELDDSRRESGASGSPPASARLQRVDAATYRIEYEVARGGMGRVLAAFDRRHERPVAIKEVLANRSASEPRFEREALITARLQHPNIVPVYEAGRWPNGSPFFAMKLVSGRSLDRVIADCAAFDE